MAPYVTSHDKKQQHLCNNRQYWAIMRVRTALETAILDKMAQYKLNSGFDHAAFLIWIWKLTQDVIMDLSMWSSNEDVGPNEHEDVNLVDNGTHLP